MLTLTRMREFEGVMRGALLTQTESLTFYQPTVSPVVLRAVGDYNAELQLNNDIALLSPGGDEYSFADRELLVAERQIIKLAFRTQRFNS
jgi:hypothetical protein